MVVNSDVGRPIAPVAPAAKTLFPGSSLVPDLTRKIVVARREVLYWVGVHPSCPVEGIDCAGVNFPKVNEKLLDDPMRSSQKRRVPVIGSIVRLTEDRIRAMRDKLPRLVIRFTEDEGEAAESGTGLNVGDVHRRPRRGHVLTIPTDAELAAKMAANRAARAYVAGKNDVPAARFMFAQVCADQVSGSRGDVYPEPLELTGLAWPFEMDADALLG